MRRLSPIATLTLLAGALASGCNNNGLMENARPDMTAPVVVVPPDMTVPKPIPDLSVPPPPPDLTVLRDMTPMFYPADAGPICGAKNCNQGDLCCVSGTPMNLQFQCAKTCSDGGLLALSCTGPEMCGGNPCCIDVGLGGGGGLSAGAVGCGMQGMNSCVPKIDFGAQALKTRFCHQDPDCGGGGALCCTAHAGMANLNICIDAQTMQFLGMLGGLVTCP